MTDPPRILVVDDDADAAEMFKRLLESAGMEVETCESAAESLAHFPRSDLDAVLTDLSMAGMDGLALCRRLVESVPGLPVVVITGHASLASAVKALRVGAFDYLTKPVEPDLLVHAVRRALDHRRLRAEVRRLQERAARAQAAGGVVASSRAMRRVLDTVERVAATDATVLITGESGTGKELVARTVHARSARAARPFVALNCAAIPANLIESELFGHAKGAFTSAHSSRAGLFLEADGGTIFLDEIGEMPMEMQAKLLRALQERAVRPVGSNAEVPFDARILAATNRDLETEIHERRFREDLYYRLAVVVVELPPLRDRAGDVPLMVRGFVKRYAERHGKAVTGVAPDALQLLAGYRWPGNVRELENCVERAVALAAGDAVTADDLPARVRNYEPERFVIGGDDADSLPPLAEITQKYVQRVLRAVGGNKSKAARQLGIDRRTLYRMFEREEGGARPPAEPDAPERPTDAR